MFLIWNRLKKKILINVINPPKDFFFIFSSMLMLYFIVFICMIHNKNENIWIPIFLKLYFSGFYPTTFVKGILMLCGLAWISHVWISWCFKWPHFEIILSLNVIFLFSSQCVMVRRKNALLQCRNCWWVVLCNHKCT